MTRSWLTGARLSWLAVLLATGLPPGRAAGRERQSPYPPSPVIAGRIWHWETRRTAAPGSDLWPSTWGADDHLYTAWGDGGGFGGTDQEGRVALGFARLAGPPERCASGRTAVVLSGGGSPEKFTLQTEPQIQAAARGCTCAERRNLSAPTWAISTPAASRRASTNPTTR